MGASRLEDTQPRAELSGAHLSPAPSQQPAAGSCGPGALSCCLRASWTRGQTSPWAAYSSLYSPGQRLAQGTPGGLVHRPPTSLGGPLRSDSARPRSGARRPGPWERGSGVWMRETEPRFPAVPICPERPVGPGPGPRCGCGQGGAGFAWEHRLLEDGFIHILKASSCAAGFLTSPERGCTRVSQGVGAGQGRGLERGWDVSRDRGAEKGSGSERTETGERSVQRGPGTGRRALRGEGVPEKDPGREERGSWREGRPVERVRAEPGFTGGRAQSTAWGENRGSREEREGTGCHTEGQLQGWRGWRFWAPWGPADG